MSNRNNTQSFFFTYKKLHKDIEMEIDKYNIDNSYTASVILDRVMILFFLQGNRTLDKNFLQSNLSKCINNNESFHLILCQFLELMNTEYSQRNELASWIPYINIPILPFSDEQKNLAFSNELYQLIFEKFNKYNWSLEDDDNNQTITPSMLGKVFERYINQKEMGAYFTENDTTNYISKNAVTKALINKMKYSDEFLKSMVLILRKNPETFINVDENHKYNYEQNHYQNILLEIKEDIYGDKIKSFEDLIKNNINLFYLFKQTIKRESSGQVLKDIYKSLKNIKILDPTCGTGAFIVSALNILLELYNTVIERYCYDSEDGSSRYENKEFQLVKYCIENNLYGVDLMDESIEILKTKLYLHLMYYYKNFDKTIPFPDINMNFKSGNALVGDLNGRNPDYLQLDFNIRDEKNWESKTKPFHWNREYSEVIESGGFDCIIGNPPYIEYSKVRKYQYEVYGYKTMKCGNLFAFTLERSYQLLKDNGILGMIIPISIISTQRMSDLTQFISDNSQFVFYSNFGDRPGTLFNGVHQKLTIMIAQKTANNNDDVKVYTSNYYHWYKNERNKLFNNIYYQYNPFVQKNESYLYKIGDKEQISIINKINKNKQNLKDILSQNGSYKVYLSLRMTFWAKAFLTRKESNEFKTIYFPDEMSSKLVMALLNSSLFFMFWETVSDCWHITNKDLESFKIDIHEFDEDVKLKLKVLAEELEDQLERSKKYIGSVQTEYEYMHKKCKHVIDKIDYQLSKHYGLNESELEYLKFYQLRYRMSDELETYLCELGSGI